jgi:hypothetical protein
VEITYLYDVTDVTIYLVPVYRMKGSNIVSQKLTTVYSQ